MPTVRLSTETVDRSGDAPVRKGPGDLMECDEETAKYIVSKGRGSIVRENAPEAAVTEAPEKAIRPRARARTKKREE